MRRGEDSETKSRHTHGPTSTRTCYMSRHVTNMSEDLHVHVHVHVHHVHVHVHVTNMSHYVTTGVSLPSSILHVRGGGAVVGRREGAQAHNTRGTA